MNQRFVSVLIFAFAVAGGASLVLYRLLAHRIPAKPAEASVHLVVAARNLEPGALIRDQDLKMAPWSGALPAGASTKKEELVGRGVIAATFVNEAILDNRLAARGAGGGLAAMIPPGMRAVAVRVNEVVGVGGFVVPGMRVDVLISGNPPNADGRLGSQTKTLVQNIEVLSAGQDYRKDSEGKPVVVPVVNLLVTPQQAEQLSLAASQTSIQLVLRNPLDTQTAKTGGAAMAQLFGRPAPADEAERPRPQAVPKPAPARAPVVAVAAANPPAAAPSSFVVETIHGSRRVETKFQEAVQ